MKNGEMRKGILFLMLCAVAFVLNADVAPCKYYGKIARRVGDMLPRYHVLQHVFDDEISCRAWTNLVSFYDFDHSVFLQSDLDRLAAHERTIDDEIAQGDVQFGYDVYNLYVQRLHERIDFATNFLMTASWDFSTNETFRIRRKDAPWPKTRADAEEHWRKRIRNDMLTRQIGHELNQATNSVDFVAEIIKSYRQYMTVLTEPDEETVLQHYLSAVCRAYDPHSDYMSPTSKEDFDMEMNLSLCGIGATLSLDDGALKIVEVIPGSPCERDGRIKEGDKIVGVQQEGGVMEDIMWQPMKKSIKKIRGKKGTRVILQIVPRSDPSGATKCLVDLVRDEIKLEDQAVTGHVERVEHGQVTNKLGYVYLPSFYGTIDKKVEDPNFRSCAMDIAKYICDFNAQGVEGLVFDLRGDGGGSLREAVLVSALFVSSGPVVQIRDLRTVGCLPIPVGNPIAFHRPMVVLIDRSSASASEIVAGHLRDTGRAIVLGDVRTHGKGTVQTVMGIGPEKYGSVKITTARFYRINGRSTQIEGVPADIHLPSLLDALDIGEDKLTFALPFTCIQPANYLSVWDLTRYLPRLRKLSEARTTSNEKFVRHVENVRGMKEISEREEVSLEYATRKAQMAKDRELRELDNVESENADDDETASQKHRRRRNEPKTNDVVLEEAYHILSDLLKFTEEDGNTEMPPPPASAWGFF